MCKARVMSLVHYVAIKKTTIHMYYSNKSHDSLNMLCDYNYMWIVFLIVT